MAVLLTNQTPKNEGIYYIDYHRNGLFDNVMYVCTCTCIHVHTLCVHVYMCISVV